MTKTKFYTLTANNRIFYVGSTLDTLKQRLRLHLSQARTSKGINKKKEAFIRECLDNNIDIDINLIAEHECDKDARYIIENKYLQDFSEDNRLLNGINNNCQTGKTTRKRMSKPVVLTKNGESITYGSQREAAQFLSTLVNKHITTIRTEISYSLKYNKLCHGYEITYPDDLDHTPIKCYKLNQLYKEYRSTIEAAKDLGLTAAHISSHGINNGGVINKIYTFKDVRK